MINVKTWLLKIKKKKISEFLRSKNDLDLIKIQRLQFEKNGKNRKMSKTKTRILIQHEHLHVLKE